MCRHLAYLGPSRSLSSLLYEPPESLERQSWKPRFQREGAMNAGTQLEIFRPAVLPRNVARPEWTTAPAMLMRIWIRES